MFGAPTYMRSDQHAFLSQQIKMMQGGIPAVTIRTGGGLRRETECLRRVRLSAYEGGADKPQDEVEV